MPNLSSLLQINFNLVDLISWLLFGLATGIVANFFDPEPSTRGLLSTILLGIVGAIVGGIIAEVFFQTPGITGFNITSFIVAVAGTLIVLSVRRAFLGDSGHIKTTIEHKEGE